MGELVLTCPVTGKKVATGIEIDSALGRQAYTNRMTQRCPLFGATHTLRRPTLQLSKSLYSARSYGLIARVGDAADKRRRPKPTPLCISWPGNRTVI